MTQLKAATNQRATDKKHSKLRWDCLQTVAVITTTNPLYKPLTHTYSLCTGIQTAPLSGAEC